MKFAVWILIILAVVSLFSMFLAEFYQIDTRIPEWQQYYKGKFGWFYSLIIALKLNDPYHSWWYQVLLLVLGASLFICLLDNIPKAIKKCFGKRFISDIESIQDLKYNAQLNIDKRFFDKIPLVFKGYKLDQKSEGDKVLLSASKDRIGYSGPVLIHIGLLLLLGGGLLAIKGISVEVGGFPGEIVHNDKLDFGLRIDDFQLEYYPLSLGQWVLVDGQYLGKIVKKVAPAKYQVRFSYQSEDFYQTLPAEYLQNRFDIEVDRSNVREYITRATVIEDGKEVVKGRIEVNKPLRYRGYRIYQSSFDSQNPRISAAFDSALVEITSANLDGKCDTRWLREGEEYPLADGTRMILTDFTPDFRVSEEGVISASEYLRNPAVKIEVWRDAEILDHQWCFLQYDFPHQASASDYNFKLLQLEHPRARAQYRTILELRKNQGFGVIWGGMISAFSGLLLSFYFNPRQIWAIIIHRENETVLYIAGKSDRFQFADEFETLVERIQAGFPKAG